MEQTIQKILDDNAITERIIDKYIEIAENDDVPEELQKELFQFLTAEICLFVDDLLERIGFTAEEILENF